MQQQHNIPLIGNNRSTTYSQLKHVTVIYKTQDKFTGGGPKMIETRGMVSVLTDLVINELLL